MTPSNKSGMQTTLPQVEDIPSYMCTLICSCEWNLIGIPHCGRGALSCSTPVSASLPLPDTVAAECRCRDSSRPTESDYPNASKTCLIVKEEKLPLAASLFEGTGVSIAKDGKRHLGAALGSDSFVMTYVCKKVATWVQEVERLSSIAITQPQSAFAAFTHGLTSKWSYLSRTIPDIGNLLQPLEDAIRLHFLPKPTGQNPFNDTERELMALPARLGGLGISNPVDQAPSQHRTSIAVTTPLVDLILQQATVIPAEVTIIQIKPKLLPTKIAAKHNLP